MVSTLKSFAKNALQYVHIYDKMVVIQKNRQAPARTIVFSMEGMNNRFSCLQISYAVLDPENDDVTSWHVPIRTEADAHPSCSFHLHLRRKKRTPWIISGIIMANYKGNGSNSNLSRFINHATIGSKIIFNDRAHLETHTLGTRFVAFTNPLLRRAFQQWGLNISA